MPRMIDFNNSSLAWETTKGSVGRFKLVASLKTDEASRPYFLGAPVLAGDVYGTGVLLRKPPYHFIWATDGVDSHIFRINSNHMLEADERPAEPFERIWVAQSHREASEVNVDQLVSMGFEAGPLMCRISVVGQVLEFPVNHINAHKKLAAFQIETGPVLASISGSILPYFVFMNSTKNCQLVLGYPGVSDEVSEHRCDMSFFVYT